MFLIFNTQARSIMMPSLVPEIAKEHVPSLRFPALPVKLSQPHKAALDRKIRTAMTLGNTEQCKCRILFKDDQGLKYVETTIWSADADRIVLKSGITIPIARVVDVDLV